MDQSAPLANFTNEVMAGRFSDVMWLLEQILWKRFDQRLAGFLLEESALEGTDVLKITHVRIGQMSFGSESRATLLRSVSALSQFADFEA